MSHVWKVIGRIYGSNGDLQGNIIGLSGDTITVESVDENADGNVYSARFTISVLEKSGYRIEWVNIKPVGVYHGEF